MRRTYPMPTAVTPMKCRSTSADRDSNSIRISYGPNRLRDYAEGTRRPRPAVCDLSLVEGVYTSIA